MKKMVNKTPRPELSIKAYIGDGKEGITEQSSWPEVIKCPRCKDKAELLMVVEDPKGKISDRPPKRSKMWPHDSMTIAHYFCSNCGEIEAHWNQA